MMIGAQGLINAQTVYSNTSDILFYTAAKNSAATGKPVIYLDDVNIPSTIMGTADSFDVTGITFGFGRYGRQTPLWVDFYYSGVNPASSGLNDICNFPPVHFDSLNAFDRGVFGNLFKSFGDSVNTLFRVYTKKDVLKTGYNSFFAGMSFSIPSDIFGSYSHGPLYTTNGTAQIQKTNSPSTWYFDGVTGLRKAKINGGPGALYLVVWGKPAGSNMQPIAFSKNISDVAGSNNSALKWSIYPNPVNSNTRLQLTLIKDMKIRVEIFDATGRIEKILDKGIQLTGTVNIDMNVAGLSSGVHIVKLIAGDKVYTKAIYK